ncbi:MAG: hypothetical protein KAG18_04405 [Sinobacterium sp.]|nr:hypothetical protein [Sinobacterium sp.]
MITLLKRQIKIHASSNFQRVSYNDFRQALFSCGSEKIMSKGQKTFVYDTNNRMLAIIKSATLDAFGQASNTEYYLRAA